MFEKIANKYEFDKDTDARHNAFTIAYGRWAKKKTEAPYTELWYTFKDSGLQ